MQYEDFDISIEAVAGRTYQVVVLHSPAGEAREMVDFPFDDLKLKLQLSQLENALLKSSGRSRREPSKTEQPVLAFGQALFEFLMHGEVGRRYAVSYDRCQQAGKGLRLKLRIQDPLLAALPWEFLYDQRFDHYLVLSQRTPLLRYLDLPRPLRPLHVTPPLRMLGMVASPNNLPRLDVAVEKARVEEALRDLRAGGLVELTWLAGQGWRDLQRAMRRGPWHLFHFIGHGGFDKGQQEGYLVFADRQGEAARMSATNLARLLGDHNPLRVVLLNSCEGGQSGDDVFSSTASTLVRSGIPCVVAMQYEITDAAAVEFARTFYESLADGLPTETAVSDARKSITFSRQDSLEWGTPVIFTHAPDGVLFTLAEAAAVPPEPASPTQPAPRPDAGREPRGPRLKLPWRLNARGLPMIESWEQLQQVEELPSRIVWAKDQKEMALIPAGRFVMGTTEAEARQLAEEFGWPLRWPMAETPQRTLMLPDYYLDVTPVTHIEYARFLDDNPAQRAPHVSESWAQPYNWDEKRRRPPDSLLHHPVVLVSWDDAQAYARWAGKLLPTEEQWEKGARGTDGRRYPWGDMWDSARINCAERLAGREIKTADEWNAWWNKEKDTLLKQMNTTVAGSYHRGASPFGLLDMAGNIWEWCDAWYDAYPGSQAQHDDLGRQYRVVRGGSWNYNHNNLRCANRGRDAPDLRNLLVGFRCASTAF